jgi:hypothetical protein
VKETGWCLGRRLVPATANARLDVKLNILLNSRPIVVLHKRATSLVHSIMISQLVMMQLQQLLVGNTIVGRDAEPIFEEEKAIIKLEKGVSFRVLNDGGKQSIFGVTFAD